MTPVDVDDVTPKESEVLGTFINEVGQRSFTQLAQNYTDRQIHLSYCRNPYILNPKGYV